MKKFFTIVVCLTAITLSPAQNFTGLGNYEFPDKESYKPAEDNILLCANYLFNNPADQAVPNRSVSVQYIIKWMSGTPDHTFDIGEKAMELTEGNSDLLGLYLAAMTKVVLENTGEKLNADQIYDRAQEILIMYCSNPDNKMKPSKKMKKIIRNRQD